MDTEYKNSVFACVCCGVSLCSSSSLFTSFFFLSQMFVSGTKVLACWTDCRFYPAKILRVNRDGEAQFHLLLLMFCYCAVELK